MWQRTRGVLGNRGPFLQIIFAQSSPFVEDAQAAGNGSSSQKWTNTPSESLEAALC